MPTYPGDLLIPGQQPLWPEYCRHCGLSIEADHYGIWIAGKGRDATHFCARRKDQELHEPGGVLL